MVDKQIEINKELSNLRKKFIEEHGLSCENCSYLKANGKCASKIYCIVRDNVFYTPFEEKSNENQSK